MARTSSRAATARNTTDRPGPALTIRQALKDAFTELSDVDISRPDREAEWLMAATLGVSRARVWLEADGPLPDDKAGVYRDAVHRRAEGVPLAYLAGLQPFRHLELEVRPGVFIPRPETELLAERAIQQIEAWRRFGDGRLTVIDIGTGSGAVALSIAQETEGVVVIAVDISPEVLEVAAGNARRHGLTERVFFCQSDILADVDRGLLGRVDLIVSNPPYVPREDLAGLPREVQYEPAAALDGGPRGLSLYRRIAVQAAGFLRPEGRLMLEVGLDQAEEVGDILAEAGFQRLVKLKDYAGIDRMVTAAWPQ